MASQNNSYGRNEKQLSLNSHADPALWREENRRTREKNLVGEKLQANLVLTIQWRVR